MRRAIELGRQGLGQTAENPSVGCVVVQEGTIVGQGRTQDGGRPHAEVMALANAGPQAKGATAYVTLEPCSMCVGAIIHARISRLVFGAYDAKTGAVTTALGLLDHSIHNHCLDWEGGVLETDCAALLKSFFKKKRQT